MQRRTFLTSLAATAVLPRAARAQAKPPPIATDVQGRWSDLDLNPDNAEEAKRLAPDKREREQLLANVQAFLAVLKTHSAWKSPMGFDVHPHLTIGTGSYWDPEPPHPIPSILYIQTFWYRHYPSEPKPVRSDEALMHLFVLFNVAESVFDTQYAHIATDGDGPLYWEPRPVAAKATTITAFDTGRMLTKRTAPIFVPVSQKRLLAAWLADARKEQRTQRDNKYLVTEIAKLEHELAGFSAADAAAQAFVRGPSPRVLAKAGDKDARPVAAVNPSFFDPKLPRTALQLANVGYASTNPPIDPEIIKLRDELNHHEPFSKLRDLLA